MMPNTDHELLLLMNEKLDRLVNNDKDHEERIRCLEKSFWQVIGVSSMISFFAGMFGGKLGGGIS